MKRKSFVSVLFRFHFMRADPITIMIRRRGNRGELFFDEFFLFTSFLTTSLLNSMSVQPTGWSVEEEQEKEQEDENGEKEDLRISPNSTRLFTSHLDTTRLDTFGVSSESRRACRACQAVLFQHGGRRTSYSSRLYKFSRFTLLHTKILFVPSNKINQINVYSDTLVNNLHIITLYKLHNKLRSESRLSRSSCRTCRASQARRVECVEPCCSTSSTQRKCMGSTRRMCEVVSCRDVTSQVEFGYRQRSLQRDS